MAEPDASRRAARRALRVGRRPRRSRCASRRSRDSRARAASRGAPSGASGALETLDAAGSSTTSASRAARGGARRPGLRRRADPRRPRAARHRGDVVEAALAALEPEPRARRPRSSAPRGDGARRLATSPRRGFGEDASRPARCSGEERRSARMSVLHPTFCLHSARFPKPAPRLIHDILPKSTASAGESEGAAGSSVS